VPCTNLSKTFVICDNTDEIIATPGPILRLKQTE